MAAENTEEKKMEDSTDDPAFKGWEKLMGKDLITKTIQPSSDSDPVAVQAQDAVVVDFVGRIAEHPGETGGDVFQVAEDCILVVGERDVLPGLEMGIRFMKQGERSLVWSNSKYAYGPGQREYENVIVPPNSNVCYEVTLKRVISGAELQQSSFILQLCESKKRIANDSYKCDGIDTDHYAKVRVLNIYKRAAETLDSLLQQQEDPSARECFVDCWNNIAAVHLRCKSYREAKDACIKSLEKDPNNFKALLRAAKAALLDPASSYEEVDAAIAAARTVCEKDPKLERDVEKLRVDFRRRKAQYQQRQKELYSRMAQGTVGGDDMTESKDDVTTKMSNRSKDRIADETTAETSAQKERVEEELAVTDGSLWKRFLALPWWSTILPYGFQLSLPMVMYFIARRMRQETGGTPTADESNEL